MSLPADKRILREAYKGNDASVIFLDESFELDGEQKFYILGTACVEFEMLNSTRTALSEFYNGDAIHASEMMQRREMESLRLATELVSTEHDGADVVVCTNVSSDDKNGDSARRRCLEFIVPSLHAEFGAQLFIFDHRGAANKFDQFVMSDLRKDSKLGRDVRAIHCRPSIEPLLGLPDVLAWSYRQKHLNRSDDWFEPLEGQTTIHQV